MLPTVLQSLINGISVSLSTKQATTTHAPAKIKDAAMQSQMLMQIYSDLLNHQADSHQKVAAFPNVCFHVSKQKRLLFVSIINSILLQVFTPP